VDGSIDLGTDSGRLRARIMIAVAEAEQERKAERQYLAFEQAAIKGKRFTGCPRPFGYLQGAPERRGGETVPRRAGSLAPSPSPGRSPALIPCVRPLARDAEPDRAATPGPGGRTAGRGQSRDDALAYLWLYAGPRLPGGSVWPTAGLPQWHERFRLVIEVAAEFAHFLTARVDAQTRNAAAVQAGVMLQAPSSIAELVDSGRLRVLPAARPSNEFLGYVIADPAGKPPGDVARSVLTLLCDHAMHLDGF